MAAVMGLERVRNLLNEAAMLGCSVAWMEAGALRMGDGLGKPRYAIDFVRERLVELRPEKRGSAPGRRDETRAAEAKTGLDAGKGDALQVVEPSAAAMAGRRTGHYAVVLEGKIIPATSFQSLLLATLETIEGLRPGTLDKLSRDRSKGKRIAARERDLLYKTPRAPKFSKQIAGGWWVAINNSGDEVEKFIRRAAFHAGLDVDIRR